MFVTVSVCRIYRMSCVTVLVAVLTCRHNSVSILSQPPGVEAMTVTVWFPLSKLWMLIILSVKPVILWLCLWDC